MPTEFVARCDDCGAVFGVRDIYDRPCTFCPGTAKVIRYEGVGREP